MTGRHAATPSLSRLRFVWLHIRARSVPVAVAGVGVVVVLAWLTATWLVNREFSTGPAERWVVAALAPLIGALVVTGGFAGADEELERTAAVRWRPIRTVHVVVAVVAVGAGIAATGLLEPHTYGSYELARNSAACIGLVALGTAVLGLRLGWIPAVGYVLLTLGAATPTAENAWWTWPIQLSTVEAANRSAILVAAVGALTYIWFGARTAADR